MNQLLTVVLPMHNCERQLRSAVLDLLDLAPSIGRPLAVVIVDDGSTDDTFETACELARSYPQVTVLRQPIRKGVGAALDLVRNRRAVETVVVHDGVSAIDAAQLQALLLSDRANASVAEQAVSKSTSTLESSGSRRFAAIRSLHDRMEHVHRSATCFCWMHLEKPLIPRRCQVVSAVSDQEPVLAGGAPVHLTSLPMGLHSTAHT